MRSQWLSKRDTIVRNLLSVYRKAEPADILDGSRWYPLARSIVNEWSTTYGLSRETVACVIAAISPQCDWERNLIIADDILADRDAISIGGALPKNIAKARKVRDYELVSLAEVFPYGPKVNSFALNLAGSDVAVTIDTHCIQAALNNVESTVTLKWAPYTIFAGCFERAAQRVNRPNAEFQAIIWHVWKRLYPATRKRVIRRNWDVIGEY